MRLLALTLALMVTVLLVAACGVIEWNDRTKCDVACEGQPCCCCCRDLDPENDIASNHRRCSCDSPLDKIYYRSDNNSDSNCENGVADGGALCTDDAGYPMPACCGTPDTVQYGCCKDDEGNEMECCGPPGEQHACCKDSEGYEVECCGPLGEQHACCKDSEGYEVDCCGPPDKQHACCKDDQGYEMPSCCGPPANQYGCCKDAQGYETPCCGPPDQPYPCPSDGGTDAGMDGSSAVCLGQCVPDSSLGWSGPLYVWMGSENDLVPPPLDMDTYWDGWIDVQFADSTTCATCSCDKPTGDCVPPTMWNVNSVPCQDLPTPNVTPFDAPPNWDGSCTAANAISQGQLCGGVLCARSLTVTAPLLQEEPCSVSTGVPSLDQKFPSPIRTRLIAHEAAATGDCDSSVQRCIDATPQGYRLCVGRNDTGYVHPCPDGWPERHEGWEEAEEGRSCTACTCGPSQGGSCQMMVTAYKDVGCGQYAGGLMVESDQDPPMRCTDVASGTALGSKSAQALSYQPGTCQANGGQVVGEKLTGWPAAFCCLPKQ